LKKGVKKMPLTMASIGEANTIRKVGGNEETKRFLENLGFVAGAEITVVSAIGGNVIVNIKDSRVAINQDMARHIMV
jgi:ferrous iron transport protein A